MRPFLFIPSVAHLSQSTALKKPVTAGADTAGHADVGIGRIGARSSLSFL